MQDVYHVAYVARCSVPCLGTVMCVPATGVPDLRRPSDGTRRAPCLPELKVGMPRHLGRIAVCIAYQGQCSGCGCMQCGQSYGCGSVVCTWGGVGWESMGEV